MQVPRPPLDGRVEVSGAGACSLAISELRRIWGNLSFEQTPVDLREISIERLGLLEHELRVVVDVIGHVAPAGGRGNPRLVVVLPQQTLNVASDGRLA